MRKLSSCRWTIRPGPSLRGKLTLFFNRLQIKPSAELRVYDGSTADRGQLLWFCDGCEDTAPPLIQSQWGTLHVILLSDGASGPGRTGFEAEYYVAQPGGRGPGDGTIDLRMASELSVGPPFRTSGGGYASLPMSLGITWHICPPPPADKIFLAFNSLNLPDNCSSNITLYDGESTASPLVGVFCGIDMPLDWIVSTGPSLTVQLQTSDGEEGTDSLKVGGFEFIYHSNADRYRCGYEMGSGPGMYFAPSMTLTDGKAKANGRTMEHDLECNWIIRPNIEGKWGKLLNISPPDIGLLYSLVSSLSR